MLFMVVERFAQGRAAEIYQRVRERGRMLPEGLVYVDSWVSANLETCFQLMECDDPALFQEWITHAQDLVEFEIIPVVPSRETAALMKRLAGE